MRYCVSDIHGEYELFYRLLENISFSDDDVMYICGDMIDKGKESVKLLSLICNKKNIRCIIGNHEYEFLKLYHSLMESSNDNYDSVLSRLRDYFSDDGNLLTWEIIDWLDSLPLYIEEENFICVHSGVPLSADKKLADLASVEAEYLVYDRKFKDPESFHTSPKCVLFGHTQTNFICGESKILAYRRNANAPIECIGDLYKVHLDTGTWSNGVLGCFCIDTCKATYVKKS